MSQVYQQSISAVAQLDWPKEKILIQVLDDSSDAEVQTLISNEVCKWQQNGTRIVYRHRIDRTGYKAGNLKSAMSCNYVKDYEFVAIFDADFQPPRDFLKRTVIHFKVPYCLLKLVMHDIQSSRIESAWKLCTAARVESLWFSPL